MNVPDIKKKINKALIKLEKLNPNIAETKSSSPQIKSTDRSHRLKKVLVANRGEIAKRFFLALHEEGIPSVAVVTDPDKGQSWYEFADEVIFIGEHYNYGSISTIIAAASIIRANAIYSGYGFLSENADFVEVLEMVSHTLDQEIIFMGPDHETIRQVGDKSNARKLARAHDIPLFESSGVLIPENIDSIKKEANRIGYPVILKLLKGGGGKGMYHVFRESDLPEAVNSCSRIGKDLYNDDTFYLEKYIDDPIHIEVQIFNGRAIGIRKCAVQRRNQKIIEESGHTFLNDYTSLSLLATAEKIAHVSGYSKGGGAGTIEFLFDTETGKFGFMEVNTRLQVEYAVTDQSLGIDIAKWQILYFDERENEILGLEVLKGRIADKDHSIECRIYAEEPENDYLPSPGTIHELDLPTFNGIRCDFGFGEGDSVLPMYDPMIGKLIAHGSTRKEALIRLERALQELYIKGVKTNINQLLRIVRHESFISGEYTNNILNDNGYLSFKESADTAEISAPQGGEKQIIFGAITEHIRLLQEAVQNFMVVATIEGYLNAPLLMKTASRYTVEYNNSSYGVSFIQTSIDTFLIFIDSIYKGKMAVVSINDRSDDFLFLFGNSSYRIRVNRYGGYMDLRMKDDKNKINYYRMKIIPDGMSDDDTIINLTSPFQGTFISFCRKNIKAGDTVKKGEPLIILSSMKMESVINSPQDGVILSVIEDGIEERLQIEKTEDGRIIGKSIQEGELLVKIKKTSRNNSRQENIEIQPYEDILEIDDPEGIRSLIFHTDFEKLVLTDPGKFAPPVLELLLAAMQGLIQNPLILEKLKVTSKRLVETLKDCDNRDIQNIANRIILHYTYIKKLFSPVITDSGLPLFDELSLYIENRHKHDYDMADSFQKLLSKLYDSYELNNWNGRGDVKNLLKQYIFFLFKWSYQFCLENIGVIEDTVHIVSDLKNPENSIYDTLQILLEQEQAERDDSLLKYIKRTIIEKFPDKNVTLFPSLLRERDTSPYQVYSNYWAENLGYIKGMFKESLQSNISKGISYETPQWFSENIKKKLEILKKQHNVKKIFSPLMEIEMYHLENKNDNSINKIIAYSSIYYQSADDKFIKFDDILTWTSSILRIYNSIKSFSESWIEILTSGIALTWDPEQKGDQYISYQKFKETCMMNLRKNPGDTKIKGILTIDIVDSLSKSNETRQLLFYKENDSISLEILRKNDKNNLYHPGTKVHIQNQRLFNNNKWPIEEWAAEIFDKGTIEEITISGIDYQRSEFSNTKQAQRPVGSKIFTGEIKGKKACFYMKDSRISGGSTGSREGLKYIAAAYISYLKDWPLYIWNDSAGANIMEGIISLNRGAEGFMVNTLLTERTDYNTFKQYIENTEDDTLKTLVKTLNLEYTFSSDINKRHRSFQLIAVGIGPSAGLDVYGSSQASIQILLDSQQSYRVLTGSNVIRTVIGEDISNYDIGGAKILGKWTGIVDIIGQDKLHLINIIRQIHYCFSHQEDLSAIQRISNTIDEIKKDKNETIIFNEDIIRQNIDYGMYEPFKEYYYASNACIGGFAKIGGRRVLIMGARTNRGLRSTASIIKAKELLKTAHRTDSHQIIIFGKQWQQVPDYHENISMRSRMDLMQVMQKKAGIRIHIITDIEGIRNFEINISSDILIVITSDPDGNENIVFAEKNTTFIVGSYKEAFDLSHRLISLIDPLNDPYNTFTIEDTLSPEKGCEPDIPGDTSKPYDIIESVIESVFDTHTFIEFYRPMNNPVSGPHLITGLAKLNNITVGIIADQPLLKGGGADAHGTEKFRIFTEFLNKNKIPLIMLSNSSGFVPGSKQERYRIQSIGGESLDANISGTIPVVSVVLNQNYGGRLIHAFNKFLRPGITYLALEQAVLAVIGVDAAFDLLYGKKYLRLLSKNMKSQAESLKNTFYEDYLKKAKAVNDAKETDLIDWTIPDIKVLRKHLIRGLANSFRRCNKAFNGEWPDVFEGND